MKIKSLVAMIAPIPVQPFAWLSDGRPVYPLRGADSDKDDDKDENDSSEDDDEDDEEDDEADDDAASGSNITDPKDKRIHELSEESKQRRLKAKKLQKDLDDAQARLKEVEDKDKSELERLKGDHTTALEKLKKLEKQNKAGAIERAFLKNNKFKWHSADAALKLVDLAEVEYDSETGEVTGMVDAVKQLAKDHPYLIDKGEDDDSGSAGDGGKGGTPTGGSIGGSNKKGKRNAERARLEKRFPALTRG